MLSSAIEEVLQQRDRERLAEAPRARDEHDVRIPVGDKLVDKRRLVDVNRVVFAKFREVVAYVVDFGQWLFRVLHGENHTTMRDERQALPDEKLGLRQLKS